MPPRRGKLHQPQLHNSTLNELKSASITSATGGGGDGTIVTGIQATQPSNQAIFIQLNQKHLVQNNLNMANNTDDTDSMHSDSNTNSNTMTTTSKSYKSEDIPLTISTSLTKQTSLPRTRSAYRHRERSYCDSTDSNESNDESDYKSGSNHSHKQHTHSQHSQYSTINTSVGANGCGSGSGMDYLRKSTPHLHRNMNNNNTIASTPNHRYRWTNNHSNSAIVTSHPHRNNNNFNKKSNHFSVGGANSVLDTMTMQPNHHHHHHHRSIPSKFHRQNFQFNNNFIVTNQKQSNGINGLGANNEQNDGGGGDRIGNDQHNGNHLSTMHSRSNGSSRLHH